MFLQKVEVYFFLIVWSHDQCEIKRKYWTCLISWFAFPYIQFLAHIKNSIQLREHQCSLHLLKAHGQEKQIAQTDAWRQDSVNLASDDTLLGGQMNTNRWKH